MTDPNSDLWNEARLNVASNQNRAHWRAICERHEWDEGTLVRNEVERLLKSPLLAQGEE